MVSATSMTSLYSVAARRIIPHLAPRTFLYSELDLGAPAQPDRAVVPDVGGEQRVERDRRVQLVASPGGTPGVVLQVEREDRLVLDAVRRARALLGDRPLGA